MLALTVGVFLGATYLTLQQGADRLALHRQRGRDAEHLARNVQLLADGSELDRNDRARFDPRALPGLARDRDRRAAPRSDGELAETRRSPCSATRSCSTCCSTRTPPYHVQLYRRSPDLEEQEP